MRSRSFKDTASDGSCLSMIGMASGGDLALGALSIALSVVPPVRRLESLPITEVNNSRELQDIKELYVSSLPPNETTAGVEIPCKANEDRAFQPTRWITHRDSGIFSSTDDAKDSKEESRTMMWLCLAPRTSGSPLPTDRTVGETPGTWASVRHI